MLTQPLDRQDIRRRPHPLGSAQRYPPCHGVYGNLPRPGLAHAVLRLLHRVGRTHVLQARGRAIPAGCNGCEVDVGGLSAESSSPDEDSVDLCCAWYCMLGTFPLVAAGTGLVKGETRLHSCSYCKVVGEKELWRCEAAFSLKTYLYWMKEQMGV